MANIFFALAMGAPPKAFRSDGIVGGNTTMTERRNERQRRADVATGAGDDRDGNALWIIRTIHPAKCSNGFFRSWGRGRVLRKGSRN